MTSPAEDSRLGRPRPGAREASLRRPRGRGVATRCVTPRQTCPRPKGFGRNLRSKTRWFAGFCNSHQVSHFATFFIDARAEISVAESRFGYDRRRGIPSRAPRTGRSGAERSFEFSLALSAPGLGCWSARQARGERRGGRRGFGLTAPAPTPDYYTSSRSSAMQDSTMILPQVHLRKPCYDFSFL